MATGKVKWFNNAKGYGFILPDEGGDDLFAHYSSVEMDGYKTLKAGQDVVFEVIEGPKGLQATNIQAPDSGDETTPATSQVLSVTVEDAAPSAEIDGAQSEHSDHVEPKASHSS